MALKFKFAIASDLHIALPHTIWQHPARFHLVEYSIPAFEEVLSHLATLDLDFLLLPGDLTQHGEPENHQWLAERLTKLPYPVYVIAGNHDVPRVETFDQFTPHYTKFGFNEGISEPNKLYYECEVLPNVRLIGLNSNRFDEEGQQIGWIDDEQLDWLQTVLDRQDYELNLVTIHHNVLEHMHDQSRNALGKRYMLGNNQQLCEILHRANVKMVFTGHLHVQDIAYSDRYDLYDITTGSLVSYPHPYRVLNYISDNLGDRLEVESFRVKSIPEQADFLHFSREWMGNHSHPFVLRLLTHPPLNLPLEVAEKLTPDLRYFWAYIADGDADFHFPHFPKVAQEYFEAFSDVPPKDNNVTLNLKRSLTMR
ncbi:metallophosphoesterase family protein [Pseudanabaena yagii]|uniref:Metallophosphoesterase n=1 Tax=Pseudanabaena yagii GIHE-NHR1 TaxID=2722753 RepID=A0ABX1LLP3_9CYAN|nr:metallophosphoesterase [Pseudanabaena yagii]NMF57003.1 metallophosphoesterase [Pseudanabaena yagii GIHE-NHR1]